MHRHPAHGAGAGSPMGVGLAGLSRAGRSGNARIEREKRCLSGPRAPGWPRCAARKKTPVGCGPTGVAADAGRGAPGAPGPQSGAPLSWMERACTVWVKLPPTVTVLTAMPLPAITQVVVTSFGVEVSVISNLQVA